MNDLIPDEVYWPQLVGGPYDGERRHLPDIHQYHTIEDGVEIIYIRHYIVCGFRRPKVRFYAHQSMPGRDAITVAWMRWCKAMGTW